MKTYSMVSADFGFLILGIIMVILVCVLPLVHQESLMFMESTKTKNQSDMSAPEAKETVLIELRYGARGTVEYFVTPQGKSNAISYTGVEGVISFLKESRPQDIRLRVDRRVPHGYAQDVQLAVQHIGGRVWQVSDKS